MLVTTDPSLPDKTWEFMKKFVEEAPRREIIVKALNNSGYIVCDESQIQYGIPYLSVLVNTDDRIASAIGVW